MIHSNTASRAVTGLTVSNFSRIHGGVLARLPRGAPGQDARDIAQSACLRFLEMDAQGRVEPGRETALLSIIAFKMTAAFRRRFWTSHNRTVQARKLEDGSFSEPLDDVEDSTSSSAEQDLEHGELRKRLCSALNQLSTLDRDLLLGSVLAGESSEALAVRFGLGPMAVRKRLQRARQRLREMLSEEASEAA